MKKNKIILFGASEYGKKTLNYYTQKSNYEIIAFCDNDISKHNTYIQNIKVIPPEKLSLFNFDKIIITSMYEDEIFKQLIDMDIKKNQIYIEPIKTISYNFSTNNKNLKMGYEILFFICNILNINKISYHLDHGTLLGIIRDSTLLPWDKDIDIAILESNYDKTIEALSKLNDFKSVYCQNNNWQYIIKKDPIITLEENCIRIPITVKIFNNCNEIITNGFDIDIKFKYLNNQNLYWRVGSKTLAIDSGICFPSKDIIFQNQMIKVPQDIDKYLTKLYGNWTEPVQEWSYSKYTNIKEEYTNA